METLLTAIYVWIIVAVVVPLLIAMLFYLNQR